MNDEKNFPEPEKLKPERWLRGCPGQHTAHPFAAIPFSFGPRMCVEWRFAKLEVYIVHAGDQGGAEVQAGVPQSARRPDGIIK